MKTAIYIEDGLVQLVITPESEFEKNSLSIFNEKPLSAELFSGSFYDCRGGWKRQSSFYPNGLDNNRDKSLILTINEANV